MWYLSAIISSLFFALYILPRKFSKILVVIYTFLVGVWFFTVSFFWNILFPQNYTGSLYILLSLLEGIIWSFWILLFNIGIDKVGIISSNQWKNLQWIIGVLLLLIFLGEYREVSPLLVVFSGIFLFLSALFFSPQRKDNLWRIDKNITYPLLSAFCFWTASLLNKIISDGYGVLNQQLFWSLWILLSFGGIVVSKKETRDYFSRLHFKEVILPVLWWVLYFFASFFMLLSFTKLSGSITFLIIQLNSLWIMVFWIFWFHEFHIKKDFKRILLGAIFASVGVFLLFLSK